MTQATRRRPLPALLMLLALLLLSAFVWWRVITRSSGAEKAHLKTCPTVSNGLTVLPAPSAVTLEVLNSTTRGGIAGKARDALLADGFRIPTPAKNDDPKLQNKIAGVGQIRYGPKAVKQVRLVQLYLPGAQLVRTRYTNTTVVVSLGKGYKQLTSKAGVQQALRRERATTATPTPSPTGTATPTCTPASSSSASSSPADTSSAGSSSARGPTSASPSAS